jgi:hypothetical protein
MRSLSAVLVVTGWCVLLSWPSVARASSGQAEVCARETLMWTGAVSLGAAAVSADTGLAVAAPASGERLRTVGVSADGLAADGSAHVVTVTVGGTAAGPGTVVPGGAVQLRYSGTVEVVVSGVSVVIDRCAAVASEAPVPVPAKDLPNTGGLGLLAGEIGAASLALGLVAVRLGRPRPATAGGRAPGWRRDARPPARG